MFYTTLQDCLIHELVDIFNAWRLLRPILTVPQVDIDDNPVMDTVANTEACRISVAASYRRTFRPGLCSGNDYWWSSKFDSLVLYNHN